MFESRLLEIALKSGINYLDSFEVDRPVLHENKVTGIHERDIGNQTGTYESNLVMVIHDTEDKRVVLEVSTSGKYTSRLLRNNGFEIHVTNPIKMTALYESYRKTARNDARIWTKKHRVRELLNSYIPPREMDEICSLVRYRRSRGDQITRIKNIQ